MSRSQLSSPKFEASNSNTSNDQVFEQLIVEESASLRRSSSRLSNCRSHPFYRHSTSRHISAATDQSATSLGNFYHFAWSCLVDRVIYHLKAFEIDFEAHC